MTRAAAAPERAQVMTLAEWAELGDDVEGELVDGVLEEEEMPSFLHEIVVAWFIGVLGNWAARRRGVVAGSETKIAVGPRRGRKPDLSVYLPGRMPALSDALVAVPPHLVLEVTSPRPRDARRDRIDKLRDYARAGVGYYVIVDPQLRSVEAYQLGGDGRYAVALTAGGGRVRLPGCPGLAIDLETLWGKIDEAARLHARSARRAVSGPAPTRGRPR